MVSKLALMTVYVFGFQRINCRQIVTVCAIRRLDKIKDPPSRLFPNPAQPSIPTPWYHSLLRSVNLGKPIFQDLDQIVKSNNNTRLTRVIADALP